MLKLSSIPLILATFLMLNNSTTGHAQGDAAAKKRCDTRLAIAFLGEIDSSPQGTVSSRVDQYLTTPAFIERFSRFLNAEFNEEPGETIADDAPYHLAKYVLERKEPYKNLFIGNYAITTQGEGDAATVSVAADPNGYGYFSNPEWMIRYAGNEGEGLRLIAAYQMIHNILGAKLVAVTNAPDADVSANGRASAGCKSCHFENWFALDPLAEALSRVQRDADGEITGFAPTSNAPKKLLGDKTVTSEKELLETMVNSEEFAFNSCRLGFKFLFGRSENSCEGKIFDQCMENFKKSGLIQDALATIAKHEAFCQ